MFDPAAEIGRLSVLGEKLGALMARLPPGSPEYQAAYSAHEAFRRASAVIGRSPRWTRPPAEASGF